MYSNTYPDGSEQLHLFDPSPYQSSVGWVGTTTTSLQPLEEDNLDLTEEVITEREYDEYGRVTKETRTVYRPKQVVLPPRTTSPATPIRRDTPQPWDPYTKPWGPPYQIWC